LTFFLGVLKVASAWKELIAKLVLDDEVRVVLKSGDEYRFPKSILEPSPPIKPFLDNSALRGIDEAIRELVEEGKYEKVDVFTAAWRRAARARRARR
jgi:hypothetical protein